MDKDFNPLENYVIKYVDQNAGFYIDIKNQKSLKIIHDLLRNNHKEKKKSLIVNDPVICYYYAFYFEKWKKIRKMKKYYKIAIQKGHSPSLIRIISHFLHQKNFDKAEKYARLALVKEDIETLQHLGPLFKSVGNSVMAANCYKIMANKGDIEAIHALIAIFFDCQIYDQMILYCNEGLEINKHDKVILGMLCIYYTNIGDDSSVKKYHMIALENDITIAFSDIRNVYGFFKSKMPYDFLNGISDYYFSKKSIEGLKELLNEIKSLQKHELIKRIALKIHLFYRDAQDHDNICDFSLSLIRENYTWAYCWLGSYFKQQNQYDNMTRYWFIGASLYDQDCITSINSYLQNDYALDFAMYMYSFLNKNNLNKLNKIICNFYKLEDKLKKFDYGKLKEVTFNFECIKCLKVAKCVFLYCGHAICYSCFGKNECRLCLKN